MIFKIPVILKIIAGIYVKLQILGYEVVGKITSVIKFNKGTANILNGKQVSKNKDHTISSSPDVG